MKRTVMILSAMILALAGCAKEEPASEPQQGQEWEAPKPVASQASGPNAAVGQPAQPVPEHARGAQQAQPTQTPPQEPASNESGSGKVVETMESGGYTYAKLNNGGKEYWIASRPVTLKIGDEVRFEGGLAMPGYHSKTLDRTFDEIYFVGGIQVAGKGAAPPATMKAPAGNNAPAKNAPQ